MQKSGKMAEQATVGTKDGCAGSERYVLECIFDGRKSFNGVGGKW
ncbi:MAG: hypothetical protein ACLR8P_14345 [Clostridium fessum]